jgi:serine/threonine protein kinase
MPEGMQLLPGSHTTWHKTDMWSLGAIAVYLWWGLVPNWLPKLPTAPLHTPQEVVSQVQEHCAVQGQRSMREEQRKRQQREKRLGNNATAAAAAAGCEGVAIAWEPPQGLLEFLSGCLLADPTKRKTARELLALPWFEGERARVLERAQERGPVIPPASPTAAGTAASTSSNSWGPALEALLDEWRSA